MIYGLAFLVAFEIRETLPAQIYIRITKIEILTSASSL